MSNLRVPMFAHAGDSEDDEEDRENLVGEVEDSDDDENERIETRRRNYLLLLERAKNRKGSLFFYLMQIKGIDIFRTFCFIYSNIIF